MTINEQLTELENLINEQESKLTSLKENVKWLYKYGGSGTGSGSGGGSSSSTKTPTIAYSSDSGNITAELGQTISSTKIISAGTQNLQFQIRNKVKDHDYKAQYRSGGSGGWTSVTIDEYNAFVLSPDILSNILIEVRFLDITDNSEGYGTLKLNFITNPVIVSTQLWGVTSTGNVALGNEIFMSNYHKIVAKMQVTPYVEGSFSASCNGETKNPDSWEIGKTSTLEWTLHDEAALQDPANIGAFSAKFVSEFTSDVSGNKTSEEDIAYTLIPNTTYVIVKTDTGAVYTSKNQSNPYKFQAGAISFSAFIYNGSDDGDQFQNVTAEIYDEYDTRIKEITINKIIYERQNFLDGTSGVVYINNTDVNNTSGKWFYMKVSVQQTAGSSWIHQKYWFFVVENAAQLNWYPTPVTFYECYFNKGGLNTQKKNSDDSTSEIFPKGTSELSCEISTDALSYSWADDTNYTSKTLNSPEIYVAVALKLEENNSGAQLVELTTTSNSAIIYQDKVNLPNYNSDLNLFIPMDNNYHLLQIYGRIVSAVGTTLNYEWVFYIDGIIEAAYSAFTTRSMQITGVKFNSGVTNQKGVFTINHFNFVLFDCVSYKRWDGPYDSTTGQGYTGLDDVNIVEYYYKWLCANNSGYNEGDYSDKLVSYKKINYSYDTNNMMDQFPNITSEDASTIELYSGLPTLVLQFKQKDMFDRFFTQMQSIYSEEAEIESIDVDSLQYYKAGNNEASTCDDNGVNTAYSYQLDVQGSSTKGFQFKNWELSIKATQEEGVNPIYSFDYDDKDGFFPEQSFTFKADIVDSSHSVNTTVGNFVNDTCTKFNPGYRNCLTGKPLIILVEKQSQGTEASQFYFIGIYNYNLGRKSKYNLNYAPRPKIGDCSGYVVRLAQSTSTYDNYASVEIANNSPFWDFSQFDKSILFQNAYTVKNADGTITEPSNELSVFTDNYYMFSDIVCATKYPLQTNVQKCVEGISKAGGCIFKDFGKVFSSNAYFDKVSSNNSSLAWKEINTVPDSKHQYARRIQYNDAASTYDIIFEQKNEPEQDYSSQDLVDCIYGTYNENDEITKYPLINYNSVMEYYVIMQAFGLVDSPMKNLNLKSWNYDSNKGCTFYAAFYDMDTGLGGNNAGEISISEFAFSDYWETSKEEGNKGLVTRHFDYWPNTDDSETGFDVPSSFLFAIGKYAAYYQQVHPEVTLSSEGTVLKAPVEFWSELRQTNGKLENATSFINNYFNKNFKNTHPMIWNMNYRSKYLVQSADTYADANIGKFHGRRLYRTQTWLNNRLHMLDAYFNINNLHFSSEANRDFTLYLGPSHSYSTSKLESNPDVILLRNIFTTTTINNTIYPGTKSLKIDSGISMDVKALEYSPFVLQTTANNNPNMYLFNDTSETYSVIANTTGSQTVMPYGSSRWTYISEFDTLINSGSFYVVNDYISSFKCGKTYVPTSASSGREICLYTPKMQTVNFEGATGQVGELKIYPGKAVTYLNLSDTALTFKMGSESYNQCYNLKELILDNFTGSLELTNTNILENLSLASAKMESLSIQPYSGSEPCKLENTNIKDINITASSSSDGSVRDVAFILSNDESVQKVTVSGFKTVRISNCPKLKTVTLTGTLPETLEVTECYNSSGVNFEGQNVVQSGDTSTTYKVNDNNVITFRGIKTLNLKKSFLDSSITKIVCDSTLESINWQSEQGLTNTNNITIDLSSCTKLTKVNFQWSWAKYIIFNSINIDSNVNLAYCRATSIKGTLNITINQSQAFYECDNLTTLGNVVFADNVTDASNTFFGSGNLSSIEKLTIKGTLTNIAGMFFGTAFSSTDVLTGATGFDATKVTNMKRCFSSSPIKYCDGFLNCSWDSITTADAMWGACDSTQESLGTKITQKHLTFKNAPTVDPLYVLRPTDEYPSSGRSTIITFAEDALGYTQATSLNFQRIGVRGITNSKFLTNASKCTSVSNLEFIQGERYSGYTPTTGFIFGDNTKIVSFNNCIQNYKVSTASVGNFFKCCTTLSSSLSALNVTGGLPIYDFVDYDLLKGQTTLFSTDFAPLKTITDKQFQELVNQVLSPTRKDGSASKLTTINGMFKNCTITCTDDSIYESKVLDVEIPQNNLITDISNMFEFCHAFFTDAEENEIKIYINFKSGKNIGFSNLTKLQKCAKTWKDCYLNKLSSTWFANVEGQLTTCNNAFTFAQFKQNYSDDMSDKVAYYIEPKIKLGNPSTTELEFNCAVDAAFYDSTTKGHYIIPSEFFWYTDTDGTKKNKTSSQFNGTEMFMASTLYGLLPEQLSKSNCLPTTNCTGMFKYCTIIPYHVKDIYQALLPDNWSSLSEANQKTLLSYTIYKVGIYCITPDGDATDENNIKPYLTNTSWQDSISGALIVPTINQSRDITIKWNETKTQLGNATGNYVILTDAVVPTSNADITEEDINVGEIDFIYQFNTNSIPKKQKDFTFMLPTSIGIYNDFITTRKSLSWSSNVDNTAWSTWDVMYDTLRGVYNNSNYTYKLSPLFNYQPATCSVTGSSEDLLKNIKYSDELYKIHYGVQYNGGDNVLFIDDTNTDGIRSTIKGIETAGLITDKAALLLYGPIFNVNMKVGTYIADNYQTINSKNVRMCDLISFGWYNSYGSIGDGNIATNNSDSGKRYYSKGNNVLYAYDISRNAIFPAAANGKKTISNLVTGGIHQETSSNGKKYTIYRQITRRDESNYNMQYLKYYN